MTFTVGPARPRPGKVRPRPGPQPAKLLLTSPGPARACTFQARTRPGPQNIIESWPGPAHGLRAGPAHGLRAGPAHGPRPGPCRTLVHIMILHNLSEGNAEYFSSADVSSGVSPVLLSVARRNIWSVSLQFC